MCFNPLGITLGPLKLKLDAWLKTEELLEWRHSIAIFFSSLLCVLFVFYSTDVAYEARWSFSWLHNIFYLFDSYAPLRSRYKRMQIQFAFPTQLDQGK